MEENVRKKRKMELAEGVEDENTAKKPKRFNAKKFRNELTQQNLVTSLKEFLNLTQQENNADIVSEYLEAGGSVQEILLLLDASAKSDLTSAFPVFRVLHLIFLSVKGKDSRFYAQAEDGARFMLDSFIPTIQAMININSNKYRKIVLKVLTSIVTLFPCFGRDVMNLIPTTPVLSQFLQPQSGTDSVRKWFIFFILSFIINGDNALIKSLMTMKGLLSDIMINLKYDDIHTVSMFLSVVKQKILENVKITKTLKLKVFYTQVIVSLFELYNWKDSKSGNINALSRKKVLKEKIVDKEEKELITESVHSFLLVLCASKKFGVAFFDSTFGAVGEGKNNLLCTVLQLIPEPWENKRMSELVIAMVQLCPDLMKVILSRMEDVIKPRESKKWITLIQFVENLLEAVSPMDILKTAAEVSEVDIVRLAKQFCTPSLLISNMSLGVHRKNSFSILYYSMRVLTLMWRKTKEVLAAFEGQQKLARDLKRAYTNCFLEVDEILEIWESVSKLPTVFESIEKHQFLYVVLDYLEIGSKCGEDVFDSPSRIIVKMLAALDAIRESLCDSDYLILQSRIFYLLIAVDPTSLTPNTDLFRRAITSLLTENDKTGIESVTKILISAGVFEDNESEIDIWLACYFEKFENYQHSIPEVFTDCISRVYLKRNDCTQGLVKALPKNKNITSEPVKGDESPLTYEKSLTESLTESPMLMLVELLEMSKSHKKMKDVQEYISSVTFRLYHYYNNNRRLLKLCRRYKKEIADPVLRYLRGGDIVRFIADGSDFFMQVEKALMTWIFNVNNHVNLESIFRVENTYNFSLFLPFNTVTSYLVTRVSNDSLNDNDVTKLSSFFSYFLTFGSGTITQNSTLILSCSVEDLRLLRTKCIQCLFSLPLIHKFDMYEYENKTIINFTKIITSVILAVSKEDLRNLTVFRPWKRKILHKIRTNLRDNSKTMEIFESMEPVLDRFTYTSGEVFEVVREYCKVTDMKTFFDDGHVTMSVMILAKFVKLQCEFVEISEKTVKQLLNIMDNVIRGEATNVDVLDDCFAYLLKNRPKTISFITNDFLENLLQRASSSGNVVTLGKLLLSDPAKVDHFIRFARKNFKELKNKKTLVALSSALVLKDEDPFLELLRSRKFCRFWKESELVGKEDESDVSRLLKMIYKKYEKHILLEKSRNVAFVLQHERFFAFLTKCFLGKENLLRMKEKMIEGSFLPEVIHETILKYKDEEDVVETYIRGLLNICLGKLQEAENGTCSEEVWSKYANYTYDIVNMNRSCNEKVVINSAMWKDFVRLSLRICFNFPGCPSFLKAIRHFIELLYSTEENNPDVKNIFNMLISHSQFLSVMLQESHLKCELVKLYYSLIKRNCEIVSVKHIPCILASYTASLSENDVTLLNILRFYEQHNLNVNEYEPVVWGEQAITHYSVKSNVGMSLWRRINMLNVLEMLDSKKMEASLKEFPVTRSGKIDEIVAFNEKVYDPAFLLPIFANLLSPGAVTYCLPFVQKGCFAYAMCALSSTSRDIRVSGSIVLARLYNHLELVQTMKLKSVWLHFINCLRYAIEDIGEKPVPSVVTYFLGKTSLELSGEPGDMFTSLQKFLLAKPVFNFDYIPEFLPLFHSSDVNYMKHRRWIIEILRDGFKQNNDLNLLFQTMAVKIILSYFKSQFCTRELKHLVLEVVTNVLKTNKSKLLISEYGLLTWLNGISLTCEKDLLPPFVKLLSATTIVIKTELIKNTPGRRNIFYPIQILNILMKILPNLGDCRSTTTVESYLTILLDCLHVMFQFNHKNWCKLNLCKLYDLSIVVAKISGEGRLVDKYAKSRFFSTFCDSSKGMESMYRMIEFLWYVLSRRVNDV